MMVKTLPSSRLEKIDYTLEAVIITSRQYWTPTGYRVGEFILQQIADGDMVVIKRLFCNQVSRIVPNTYTQQLREIDK